MCRFVLYKGPPLRLSSLITEPDHSLIHQSTRARESEEPLNGDGFGVAWYNPDLSPDPAVFRSVTPAWNNHNLLDLARVTQSPCVLAHVRAATSGQPVTELNCHPFAFGRFAFMHNGDIGGFAAIRRRLIAGLSDEAFQAIHGSTDSEHLFALVLDRLARAGLLSDHAEITGAHLAAALEGAIHDVLELARSSGVQEPSYLNAALSDGRTAVACRYTSDAAEHASSLHLHTGRAYTCENGVCRMIDPVGPSRAVLISSEPLSTDPGWTLIPPNHAVVIEADQSTRMFPVRAAA